MKVKYSVSLRRSIASLTFILLYFITPHSVYAKTNKADSFDNLNAMNKASAVMLVEQKIIPKSLGKIIADSISTVIEKHSKPGAERSWNYLKVEPWLIAEGGPEVTRLHSGRSRQDIASTDGLMHLRNSLLESLKAVNRLRDSLLQFAEKNPDAIVPAYTLGVQAQPITFGHYITAYTTGLDRAAKRIERLYREVNRCPLGSAAVGTSSFPINRGRLAELLGFDGPLVNSLDANQLSRVDTEAMAVGVMSSLSLTVSMLLSDIEAQYRNPKPWIILKEKAAGTSSIMPQKRNPNSLNSVRSEMSKVLGLSTSYFFQAHNLPHGMRDMMRTPEQTVDRMTAALNKLTGIIDDLKFIPENSLAEVNADYSTTTELADVLQREANVPFRVGHHFASLMVSYGRSNGIVPAVFPFDKAKELFMKASADYKMTFRKFPLTENRFREALSPFGMVKSSKGLGGPQPEEVKRMLAQQKESLDKDRKWLTKEIGKLKEADRLLDKAFKGLR